MSTLPRIMAVTAGLATACAVASAPATAAPSHPAHLKPTALRLTATRATVAPKHKVSLTATLHSGHNRLANETLYLEQRDASSHKFGSPEEITPQTDANGQVQLSVVPGNHKGKKEQYRVVFNGDDSYRGSHSSVITITVG